MIKNVITATISFGLVIGSSVTHANDYSETYRKQKRCETAGDLAKSFYGTDRKEFHRVANDLDRQVKNKEMSKKLAGDTKYILVMGQMAKSPTDAYMDAWSWCMDQKK